MPLTDLELFKRFRASPVGQQLQAEVVKESLTARQGLRQQIAAAEAQLAADLPALDKRLAAAAAIESAKLADYQKAATAAGDAWRHRQAAVNQHDSIISRAEGALRATADPRIRRTMEDVQRASEEIRARGLTVSQEVLGDRWGAKAQPPRTNHAEVLAALAALDAVRIRAAALLLSADENIGDQLNAMRREVGLPDLAEEFVESAAGW